MFQEMSVTTGGASATNPTAGAQLNMQFKTGANRASGAAHFYGAGEGLQSTNLPDELLPLAGPSGKGNRLKELTDVGFDVGGPIMRDKWWAWGSYGRTDGTLFTLNGDPDATKLENIAFKTHGASERRDPARSSCSSAATRSRTAAAPARCARRRDHVGSDRPDAALQGPGQSTRPATTCS